MMSAALQLWKFVRKTQTWCNLGLAFEQLCSGPSFLLHLACTDYDGSQITALHLTEPLHISPVSDFVFCGGKL